ncbi:MAG: hypothetical protein NTU74_17560 [Deltaproteobacteria bacterium]|nr:hypothetical protein [Deltaproteobacteria bacterium]
MKKFIFAILTMFLVAGFLVVDSQAAVYIRHSAYWSGPAVVVSPRPYRYYHYPPPPAVYYAPRPVAYYPPPPVVYSQPPWYPGINVFLPGVNIRIR